MPTPTTTAQASTTAAQPQPIAQPQAAAPPAEIQLQISTQPAGAEVYLGSERLGTSPIDVKRARSTEQVTFTIRRAGFKDVTRPVALDHDQTLEVALQPKRDRVAVRTTRTPGKSQPQAQPTSAQPQHRVTDLRNPFE
jgi:hypothetical protein